MAMYIDLQNKSIDYLTAMSDVRKSIAHRRGRGWSWDMIAQMLEGLGQLADVEINLMLGEMASREDNMIADYPVYCTDERSKAGNCECEDSALSPARRTDA